MPLTVRVVAPAPTVYSHCPHCETVFAPAGVGREARRCMVQEYPAEMLAEYARLCGWMQSLSARLGDRVRFEVVDPQSLGGVWLALRHGIRRYPAFIVDGRAKVVGWDEKALLEALDMAVGAKHASPLR